MYRFRGKCKRLERRAGLQQALMLHYAPFEYGVFVAFALGFV